MKHLYDSGKANRFLILCKKSIKKQWADEIQKFSDLGDFVDIRHVKSNSTAAQRKKLYKDIQNSNSFVVITTYSGAMNDKTILESMNFDMVIMDEAHIIKSRVGKQNGAVKEISKNSPFKLFLTGTPIMTKPVDIYGLMSIADPKYFGKWSDFEKKHINYRFGYGYKEEVGYKNLDELREKVQDVIIRRTEHEVSLQLPKIIEKQIIVEIDPLQTEIYEKITTQQREYQEELQGLTEKLRAIEGRISQAPSEQLQNAKYGVKKRIGMIEAMMKGLIASKQACADDPRLFTMSNSKKIVEDFGGMIGSYSGSNKTKALIELVEEFVVDEGEKVIIFTRFERCSRLLADDISKSLKVKTLIYNGTMDDDERDNAIDLFKKDSDYNVLVATDAAAEGLNLEQAICVINYDLPDSPAIRTQRMGRIRRASSTHAIGYMYDLLTENSEDIKKFEKISMASNLFDGIVGVDEAQSEALKKIM